MRKILSGFLALAAILAGVLAFVAHWLQRADPERFGGKRTWLIGAGMALLFALSAVALLRKSKAEPPEGPPS